MPRRLKKSFVVLCNRILIVFQKNQRAFSHPFSFSALFSFLLISLSQPSKHHTNLTPITSLYFYFYRLTLQPSSLLSLSFSTFLSALIIAAYGRSTPYHLTFPTFQYLLQHTQCYAYCAPSSSGLAYRSFSKQAVLLLLSWKRNLRTGL